MAEQYFLKIDGIEWESQDEQYKGAIELDSWSFGGATSGFLKVGGGASAGKFTIQDFSLHRRSARRCRFSFLSMRWA